MQRLANDEPVSVQFFDQAFMWRVFYVFAALALVSIAISVAGRYAGRSIAMAGHTDDRSVAEIVIGNNVIVAPRNMIRFDSARQSGVAAKLDLYMRWPDMAGYSNESRDDFNHAGRESNILFMSIAERIMSRDMSGRYAPIYTQLIEPTGTPAEGGLTMHRFTERSGYQNEILMTAERPGETPYVARCLDGEAAAQSLAPCERDIHVGDALSLTYRFPRELLAEWKALDAAVVARFGVLLKTAR
ncbi:MAG: hypothetical protein Q8Q62_15845 [Mesorhizobium sp.]|nr:hypothetical protein [Mesorhizobium sp.]